MKRLLALLAGALGLRALLRRRARESDAVEEQHAHTLRAKLAETRAADVGGAAPQDAEPAAAAGGEPQEAEPASADADVAERRTDVHERARRAIDELSQ